MTQSQTQTLFRTAEILTCNKSMNSALETFFLNIKDEYAQVSLNVCVSMRFFMFRYIGRLDWNKIFLWWQTVNWLGNDEPIFSFENTANSFEFIVRLNKHFENCVHKALWQIYTHNEHEMTSFRFGIRHEVRSAAAIAEQLIVGSILMHLI